MIACSYTYFIVQSIIYNVNIKVVCFLKIVGLTNNKLKLIFKPDNSNLSTWLFWETQILPEYETPHN